MLKKGTKHKWSSECQEAFSSLKEKLTTSPVLASPNFAKRFHLETDPSSHSLGGVIEQEQLDGNLHL